MKMNFAKSLKSPKRDENIYSSQRQLIENDSISIDENNKLDYNNTDENNVENIPLKLLHRNQSKQIKINLEDISQESSIGYTDIIEKQNIGSGKKRESKSKNGDKNVNIMSSVPLVRRLELSTSSSQSSIEKESNIIPEIHTDTTSTSPSSLNKPKILDSHSSHGSKSKSPKNDLSNDDSVNKNQNSNRDTQRKNGHARKKNHAKPEYIEMNDIQTEEINKNPVDIKCNYCFIGVHILGCEILQNHLFLCYPRVKLHILNCNSGKYIMNDNTKELKTQQFDFHQNGSIVPYWDEVILFDDALTKDLSQQNEVLFVFELFNNQQLTKVTKERDTIAWAFLKPDGVSCCINRKLKLQLYNCKKPTDISQNSLAFAWWKNKPWEAYPSVLNIIMKSLRTTEKQDFINDIKFNNIHNFHEKHSAKEQCLVLDEHKNEKIKLTQRLKGQNCAIPNTIIKCINIEKCSNILKFSQCGSYLACGIRKDSKQTILIYTVPEFTIKMKLPGHKNLVYDICWSSSTRLITASADSTVCLWDIASITKCLLQRMVHPAFVYSSKFCPVTENIIVTGCYDKILRIWMKFEESDVTDYTVHQKLHGHEGFINAICFVTRTNMFYSGDSVGVIIKWTPDNGIWVKVLLIDIPQFKNKIINDLQIFSENHRILVVVRNSPSWTFDVATSAVFTCYKDGIDSRYQVRGVISPCGTLVFIGNNVWEAKTGHLLATYNPNAYDHHSIMTVDYHPCSHLLVTGCGLNRSPLLCCGYRDSRTADPKLGLEIISPRYQFFGIDKKPLDQRVIRERAAVDLQKYKHNFADIAVSAETVPIEKKDFKLWSLINKMDEAILTVKAGREKQDAIVFENELGHTNNSSKGNNSDNDLTFTLDLTGFHKKRESLDKFSVEDKNFQSKEISSDNDTYTVGREIPKKTPTKNEHAFNDSSSNLSNAESLEDDMITYSISQHHENITIPEV